MAGDKQDRAETLGEDESYVSTNPLSLMYQQAAQEGNFMCLVEAFTIHLLPNSA